MEIAVISDCEHTVNIAILKVKDQKICRMAFQNFVPQAWFDSKSQMSRNFFWRLVVFVSTMRIVLAEGAVERPMNVSPATVSTSRDRAAEDAKVKLENL